MKRSLMRLKVLILLAFLIIFAKASASGDDVDQAIGTIHKIDMTDNTPKAPNYVLIIFDVKKVKVPGAHGHSILRQFAKRVRAEFEGAGLPKGPYRLAVASSCPAGENGPVSMSHFKKIWTELHRFKVTSTHIATEKSQVDTTLRPGGKGHLILEGKVLALFQELKGDKILRVDCKPIN